MLIPDRLDDMFDQLLQLKMDWYDDTGHDIPPAVVIHTTTGDVYPVNTIDYIEMAQTIMPDISPLPRVMEAIIVGHRAMFHERGEDEEITVVSVGSEVVFMTAESDDEADDIAKNYTWGDMNRDFSENADSRVTEALNLFIAERDVVGEWRIANVLQPYRRADHGKIEWGERLHADESPEMRASAVAASVLFALTLDIDQIMKVVGDERE